jgi:hypothetical protein
MYVSQCRSKKKKSEDIDIMGDKLSKKEFWTGWKGGGGR